ncbi:MAG TPA: hypothetical protein VE338_06340 [Ktedonobacterales bacterium]|jgi:hypothetical protein|nr:hypothetical protein [Ktedonobacterales bacterium]
MSHYHDSDRRYRLRSHAPAARIGACRPVSRHGLAKRDERARIVARLAAASQALAEHPDDAALLLDGAIGEMLDCWARAADALPLHRSCDMRLALEALDERAPAVSARARLALQAHNPAARLAHCWALLDALTTSGGAAHAASFAYRPAAAHAHTNKRS